MERRLGRGDGETGGDPSFLRILHHHHFLLLFFSHRIIRCTDNIYLSLSAGKVEESLQIVREVEKHIDMFNLLHHLGQEAFISGNNRRLSIALINNGHSETAQELEIL